MSNSADGNSLCEDEKYLIDKHNDVVKARAAQVLALFAAYVLAIRSSEHFLDQSSVIALMIPVAAFVLDNFFAKGGFQCPYAYELTRLYAKKVRSGELGNGDTSIMPLGLLVIGGMNPNRSKGVDIMLSHDPENVKRRNFRNWFIKKHMNQGAVIFGSFFALAVYATYNFEADEPAPQHGVVTSELPEADCLTVRIGDREPLEICANSQEIEGVATPEPKSSS